MVTRRIALFALGFGMFAVLGFGAIGARASIIDDIPDAVNGWLFDGNNDFAAGMILSGMIMAAVGLAMATARLPLIATLVILFVIMTVLVTIGWLDASILILSAMLVAALFAVKMREAYQGAGG